MIRPEVGSSDVGAPVRVLLALAPPDGTTRYVDQIVSHPHPGITIQYRSWPRLLFGRYEILHVHWPEYLIRSSRPVVGVLKAGAFALLLLRLFLTRTPLVRTLHNVTPHESGSWLEQKALDLLDRRTTAFIRINPLTERPIAGKAAVTTILHGHYRDVYPKSPEVVPIQGRLLYFGLIRPYKGIPELLASFAEISDPILSLRLVGRADSPELRSAIEQAATEDSRITHQFGFVPDEVLAREIREAELVILPYREMHNSGTLLLALSLGKPALVPRTPATEAIADEVGPRWVNLFDHQLTSADVSACLRDLQSNPPEQPPALDERDWSTVGERHQLLYRTLASRRGRKVAAGSG